MSFDISAIRQQFPILAETVYGHPLVYLDNGATTQKPQCVIDTIVDIYSHKNSNIHRGVHHLSNVCTLLHENARARIAKFINAAESSEIVFTRGTTEAINMLAFSFGETYCKAGDEIIVTPMDHHSDIVPWQQLCLRKGMTLRVASMNDKGELITDELYALINDRTKLVALPHISNVMGTVNPIEDVVQECHKRGVRVMVDAAQSIQHQSIDVQKIDCDFMAFSGHKMYAPTGIGVLYGKAALLDEMVPYQCGGEMIENVSFEKTTFNTLPFKFEAGTPNYVGAIALARAVDFIDSVGMDNISRHEQQLVDYALQRLQSIDGVRIIGQAQRHSSVVSFLVGKIHHYDTGMMLDKMGIAVRTGHHCAEPLMTRLGITGTVRASFAMYNTIEEIDILAEGIEKIKRVMSLV